jgi:hypothetical protein
MYAVASVITADAWVMRCAAAMSAGEIVELSG